jgi:hypothetical protein
MAAGPSMTIASNVVTRATGDFVADGFVVNQWVKMTGWDTAANNTIAKISALTTTTMTLVGPTLTDQGSGETDVSIVMGAQIVNGTEFRSFGIEKEFTDLSNVFAALRGMVIDTVNLSISADAIITGSFGFLGKDMKAETATFGDGSNTAAPTNTIMNAIDDVDVLYEALASLDITAFSMALANNLRARLQVGTLGAISIGTGSVGITGTLQAYFESNALMTKYLNFTETSIAIVFIDAAGNTYVLDLPAIKFTSGQAVSTGLNADVISDMAWTAKRHATEGITIRLARFAA